MYNDNVPIFKSINQDFFARWSPEMAYVLGFFAADGNMIRNSRGAYFIGLYSTDKEILLKIRNAMGSTHKISKRVPLPPWRPSYKIQIGSKKLFHELSALGFTPHKSHTLQMPKIPKKLLAHFVRGYFDGDGCVYLKQHLVKARRKMRWVFSSRFTSGSKDFLITLHAKLREYGLRGGFIADKKRGYELVFSHKDSIALASFMYDTISCNGLRLERKYRLFQKAVHTLYGDVAQW